MAIVTTAEVKTFLQISVATYDSLIASLIPVAENLFLKIRGTEFFEFDAVTTAASAEIQPFYFSDFDLVRIGDRVFSLSGSNIDGLVLSKDIDAGIVTLDTNADSTETEENLRVYPRGADFAASKIVGFLMEKDSNTGYRSERIGNYSYTKFDSSTGIPMDIANLIERYQSMHT